MVIRLINITNSEGASTVNIKEHRLKKKKDKSLVNFAQH